MAPRPPTCFCHCRQNSWPPAAHAPLFGHWLEREHCRTGHGHKSRPARPGNATPRSIHVVQHVQWLTSV
eukprot:3590186-Alexandrium_andersonii.AAC.1